MFLDPVAGNRYAGLHTQQRANCVQLVCRLHHETNEPRMQILYTPPNPITMQQSREHFPPLHVTVKLSVHCFELSVYARFMPLIISLHYACSCCSPGEKQNQTKKTPNTTITSLKFECRQLERNTMYRHGQSLSEARRRVGGPAHFNQRPTWLVCFTSGASVS